VNFIIDLGGVVVTWQPDSLLAEQFVDPGIQSGLKTGFIEHPDWVELDRGTLSRQNAIEWAISRTGLSKTDVERLLEAVPSALVLIPETVELLYRLHAQGHNLFCLSNMHPEFIDYLERRYDFWGVFNDVVVSCRVRLCKPEPEIFEHILVKHVLNPAETLFIDDTVINLTAASAFGIQTLQFQSPQQCEGELRALGYL
jgi:putative hydrolase of the HAD superfamily